MYGGGRALTGNAESSDRSRTNALYPHDSWSLLRCESENSAVTYKLRRPTNPDIARRYEANPEIVISGPAF